MKGKDQYGLFEVFRPGYMEGSFWYKFKYWFRAVFWCHFRYHALFAIVASAMLVWLVSDLVTDHYHDLDYVVAGEQLVLSEQLQELNGYFSETLSDVDGDGEVSIGQQMLCTYDDGSSDTAYVNGQKLSVTFADDQIVLYIMDRDLMEFYASEGALAPLSDFGIVSDGNYYVRVDESKLFRDSKIPSGDGWYMALKVVNRERAKDEKIQKKYNEAAKLIQRCMIR